MKGWRGKRRCISSLTQMQVHPWMDCKRAVCHRLSGRLFFCREERRGEKRKHYSPTAWPCCSYNEGPACLHPPLLSWPTPKSHQIMELHYCSKISLAGRPASMWQQSVSVAPAHRDSSNQDAGLSHRWRWQRSQYHKKEVPPQKSDPNSIKTDDESESENEHRGGQKAIFPSKSIFWW